MTSKRNNLDKIIPTPRKQAFGAKAIIASYPDKNWSISTLQSCRQFAVGSIRLVHLCCVLQVAVDRKVCVAAAGEHYKHFV